MTAFQKPLRGQVEFGTDGVRGIAGVFPLDPVTVAKLGTALGVYLLSRRANEQQVPHYPQTLRVCIGRDTRASGDLLLNALSSGLMSVGVDVVDYGIMTTPAVAHITRVGDYGDDHHADHGGKFACGIVISASHNPADQNGIKIFGADGFKLRDADEDQIEALVNGDLVPSIPVRFGRFVRVPTPPSAYYEHLRALLIAADGKFDNLTIVVDHANGAASAFVQTLFTEIVPVARLIIMNTTAPDGLNINVQAGSEYVRRDRSAMLSAIHDNQADLGIAFDGDADRVIFVTPEGMLVDGDHILGILASELQSMGHLAGNAVVATDMSNSGLADYLAAQSITLQRTKVGDRYVMERLRERHLTIGGEQAGHIILLDDEHTCGDGLLIAVQICALASREKRRVEQSTEHSADHSAKQGGATLHTLAARIPRYPQVIASAHLAGKTDLNAIPELSELQSTLEHQYHLRRVNMRFSGTEPNLFRVMVEGSAQATRDGVIHAALRLVAPVAQATGSTDPHVDLVDSATGEKI